MPLTPATLPRHELAGLSVRVADAPNPDLVGIAGRVVGESTRTLRIEPREDRRVRRVPKSGTTFEFRLEDGGTRVVVEGGRLVARPARRTERRADSRWR